MNCLYLTQSASLPMFHQLDGQLRQRVRMGRRGFYVCDRRQFDAYLQCCPNPIEGDTRFVREWEVVRQGLHRTPDRERIAVYEKRLGDPSLWSALLADRRLYQGRLAFLRQDYKSPYTHEQLLGILEENLDQFQRLFDEVRPDVVFSFICVTLGDYLGYLFAREQGIPFLSLRSTRVENYVTWATDVFEPSAIIRDSYKSGPALKSETLRQARAFLAASRSQHLKYEGALPASDRPPRTRLLRRNILRSSADFLRYATQKLVNNDFDPSYYRNPIRVAFVQQVSNRLRAWRMNRFLRGQWVDLAAPGVGPFAFFPLHTEPEVSLLVQGRGFLNQIEVIRSLATSLPVGWRLLVKEHPASVGKRPLGYYRKLLAIPNVCMVRTSCTSNEVIARASLVVTISGTIGFEAIVQGKPVAVLGNTPFEFLPAGMVRRLTAPHRYAEEISTLLTQYSLDSSAVERYIAATISCSVRANLYSKLLAREGGYVGQASGDDQNTELGALADLALTRLRAASCRSGQQ
ncbi:MAG: hypothetical protein EBT75_00615 [Proteobacteria bacterium]|nr:hypothetical protein [Pseudomonadota bacterium]NBS05995.1 hypothetical protein [Verrucomicrobiota bacterium]NBS49122.1 hypothetical protein [Verrucomicrobiota bacterium]NBS78434.1 hypothetical protein [bacterium]